MMLLSLALVAAAPVPNAIQQRDLRCVAALSMAVAGAPEAERGKMVAGVLYYVGRVEGREPTINLETAIVGAVGDEKAFATVFQDEVRRCGSELQVVGTKLQQVGAALHRRGTQP